jgi:type IV pilus assembly protein PilM
MALVRALIPATPFLGDGPQEGTCRAIADIASSVSTLVVSVDSVLKFTRVINFSSDRFARVLSEQRGIPMEDANILVQRVGLAGPTKGDDSVYSDEVVADTHLKLGEVAAELTEEVRRSLHYFQGQETGNPVSEVILSGKGALVRNLDSQLRDSLSMPVSIGNPLTHVAENGSSMPDADLAFMAPYLAVAVGLALPEEE